MDRQLIKSLIDALAASDLSELEYTAGGASLRLVKGTGPAARGASPALSVAPLRSVPAAPAENGPAENGPAKIGPEEVEPNGAVVAAPAFGIVHLRRSPGTPPLVAAGDAVVAGQVLCLIEAMKVFTELRAERGGTVAAVLVESGQEVDAGQPLFRMS